VRPSKKNITNTRVTQEVFVAKLKKAFDKADLDKNGTLEENEARLLLQKLNTL